MIKTTSILALLLLGAQFNLTALVPAAAGQGRRPGGSEAASCGRSSPTRARSCRRAASATCSRRSSGSPPPCASSWPPAPSWAGSCRRGGPRGSSSPAASLRRAAGHLAVRLGRPPHGDGRRSALARVRASRSGRQPAGAGVGAGRESAVTAGAPRWIAVGPAAAVAAVAFAAAKYTGDMRRAYGRIPGQEHGRAVPLR